MTRRWFAFAGLTCWLVLSLGTLAGCTMTQSKSQRAHQREVVLDYDARQLVEDVDLLLLFERNSRLTRWHIP